MNKLHILKYACIALAATVLIGGSHNANAVDGVVVIKKCSEYFDSNNNGLECDPKTYARECQDKNKKRVCLGCTDSDGDGKYHYQVVDCGPITMPADPYASGDTSAARSKRTIDLLSLD